ncbi:quinoprotein relay system zinc metallohydrolase 2 [Rhodoblastus acidophilus]|uniref:quinoprotein relay system zinc metallohydrolase 2 n=1 Tax=Rhodoblastus acidophilus TaxID=1074 RepID=UPI0022257407|nr:quinoprotein relay system zinc metallohydrolase 2 [Rhodoblastus acidophilus]MCW2283613.1 quinoprotein relay system zinc metallohydrolase 2 [Rhodoblastus acidophilus]MCW2332473.1 quinoprotein relay system zinc metallohydrolase 2 [Rhodoblastus acidophilus]
MRHRVAVLVVLGLAVVSAGDREVLAADQAAPSAAVEVAPGDFVLPGVISLSNEQNAGQISNSGFVVGRDGVAVIDTGGSLVAGKRLLAALRAKTDLPILYVIFTHGHPDHTLGAAAFAELKPVFAGHRALPEVLASHGEDYLRAARALVGEANFAGTRVIAPTLLVDGVTELDLGGRKLKLETWPTGHTNADLTVTDEASGVLFLGDLLFSGHIPALDGKLTGWLDNLKKLRERAVRVVVPGHGPASMAWPQAADAQEAYLRRLRDDVGAAIRKGETMRETAATAAASERPNWRLFDDFNPRNATAAYHELEWE